MDYTAFIPASFRTKIIQFLITKAAGIIVPGIAAGAAYGMSWLVNSVPWLVSLLQTSTHMDRPQLEHAVVVFVFGLLMAALNFATNHWTTSGTKVIQEALVRAGHDLKVDGLPGDKTLDAIAAEGIEVRRAIATDARPAA